MSRPPSVSSQIAALIVALGVTAVGAAAGGWASVGARSFYAALDRPGWAPPGSLFGPVWTVLYALMAVAVWLVWRAAGFPRARAAVWLFLAQLAANALWSWLFFAWRLGALAFAEVVLLWGLVAATTVAFWRIRRLPALLMLPYLAWVGFATALTFAVWQRNPALLG
jgi:benzodiazapine receptor